MRGNSMSKGLEVKVNMLFGEIVRRLLRLEREIYRGKWWMRKLDGERRIVSEFWML